MATLDGVTAIIEKKDSKLCTMQVTLLSINLGVTENKGNKIKEKKSNEKVTDACLRKSFQIWPHVKP